MTTIPPCPPRARSRAARQSASSRSRSSIRPLPTDLHPRVGLAPGRGRENERRRRATGDGLGPLVELVLEFAGGPELRAVADDPSGPGIVRDGVDELAGRYAVVELHLPGLGLELPQVASGGCG